MRKRVFKTVMVSIAIAGIVSSTALGEYHSTRIDHYADVYESLALPWQDWERDGSYKFVGVTDHGESFTPDQLADVDLPGSTDFTLSSKDCETIKISFKSGKTETMGRGRYADEIEYFSDDFHNSVVVFRDGSKTIARIPLTEYCDAYFVKE